MKRAACNQFAKAALFWNTGNKEQDMALLAAYITPHPPLAVHEVGRGREREISVTLEGFELVAKQIAQIAPDRIVIISPHTAYYADCVFIAGGSGSKGNLSQFGASEVRVSLAYDEVLRERIIELAEEKGIPVVCPSDNNRLIGRKELDHGMLVPLSFIDKDYPSNNYEAVSIGGSALPRPLLLEFGRCVAKACDETDEKCVLLVSGDLSHKLTEDGPYGFNADGPVFDEAFVDVVEGGNPLAFAELDESMCDNAAECGLSGFIMMAGALEQASADSGIGFDSELISHEGPFGVGYGVATFVREDVNVEAPLKDGVTVDPLVKLAVETINHYITNGSIPEAPTLPASQPDRSGCFVSIHTASTGDLRGCIGTISPVQDSLAEEIIANAISASTRDPRFPPIGADELDDLTVSVDVLFPAEPSTLDQMDPKKYGIIVTSGFKRGLLLPDLEGVETVEQQFQIACAKAGIDPFDDLGSIQIERFEVVRHE